MDEEDTRKDTVHQLLDLAMKMPSAVSRTHIKQIVELMGDIDEWGDILSEASDGDTITLTANPPAPAEPLEVRRDSTVLFKETASGYIVDRVAKSIVGSFKPEGLYNVFLAGEEWSRAVKRFPPPFGREQGWLILRDENADVNVLKTLMVHESDVLAVMNDSVSQ